MIKSVLVVSGIIALLLVSTAVLGGIAFTKRTRNEAKELFKDGGYDKTQSHYQVKIYKIWLS
ncbi:hypothetical protein [Thermococcus aciditolerans]|uniref:Uncharacterized protein n=1 Tax=Thermococcus aciditolerans TaxID=2598455 RepID=A0A5C0SNM8_9EURY|nr:hypothetical protein [Thermococcus aciditolerans]QEK15387.1 hypothetical protein FPV09_10105 [Thermococcus aciditolerans]